MSNTKTALSAQQGSQWGGLTTKWYIVAFVLVVASSFLNKLPGGWLGAYVYATLLGLLLDRVGEKTPIVKDYFGGGAIVTIFGGATLVYFDIIPKQTSTALKTFVTSMDYIGWVVGALICGSILSMDRKLLIKAGSLYLIPILGGLATAFGLTALGGALMGYGAVKAVMMVALPIMGGGTSAGAVPLSQIYGSALNADPKQFLSLVMPAVALGNAMSIVSGGLLNRVGKAIPSLSGEGVLMKGFEAEKTVIKSTPDYVKLGVGFLITGVFFAIGSILEKFIPMHYYALTIISVAVVKLLDILPEELIEASTQWYDLLIKTAIPAVLLGIGMVYTDMKLVIPALTLEYLVLVGLTVLGAILGAGFFGRLVGFYSIESSITAGLCMSNMGGTGDVATLGAAQRMVLMPFAQISSRIGGAVILVIGSIMVKLLGVG
jgi:Na+/citrate or Na+/malate symporter